MTTLLNDLKRLHQATINEPDWKLREQAEQDLKSRLYLNRAEIIALVEAAQNRRDARQEWLLYENDAEGWEEGQHNYWRSCNDEENTLRPFVEERKS